MKDFDFCANKSIDKRTDLDWFNRYITLAENVSNKTMQDLWAKILAGELSRPGSYSLKALKVFREMSIVDAKLLAKACSLAVKLTGKKQNIALQFYKFTPIGTELANLINDKANDDFFTMLKQQLSHHFEITSA